MAKINIINRSVTGVDMQSSPFNLGEGKLASATNMTFSEGVARTRPGFIHHDLKIDGHIQGATVYSPSRGLSHKPFASPLTALVIAAGGEFYYSLVCNSDFGKTTTINGECLDTDCQSVNLYQAENYLIIQSPQTPTAWWEGHGAYVCSPGLGENGTIAERLTESNRITKELVGAQMDCCFQRIEVCIEDPIVSEDVDQHSHDTFDFDNHKNFLINSACLGIYAHGRIHQQGPYSIYVSDIIHKRGSLSTDDILLMEEQQLASSAPPLSTNSSLGQLRAMAVLPILNSANGQGEIIAYYDRGVVSYNTAIFGRDTKFSGEGKKERDGWDTQRQVSHILNNVSAVGRKAVHALPRDQVFRSKFGIHFLKTTLGEGTFKDEFINTIAQDVQPLLDGDSGHLLYGTTISQWKDNHRIMCSCGFTDLDYLSTEPIGKGLVVWDQALRYTEDRTPIPAWLGLWTADETIVGFDTLLNIDDVSCATMFGAVTCDKDANIYFTEFTKHRTKDAVKSNRNDKCKTKLKDIPIEWEIVTGRKDFGDFGSTKSISAGVLELSLDGGARVKVEVLTDASEGWKEWCSSDKVLPEKSFCSLDLGSLPANLNEATWFQFRVSGIGAAEIMNLDVDVVLNSDKLNKTIPCRDDIDYLDNPYKFTQTPSTERWT